MNHDYNHNIKETHTQLLEVCIYAKTDVYILPEVTRKKEQFFPDQITIHRVQANNG